MYVYQRVSCVDIFTDMLNYFLKGKNGDPKWISRKTNEQCSKASVMPCLSRLTGVNKEWMMIQNKHISICIYIYIIIIFIYSFIYLYIYPFYMLSNVILIVGFRFHIISYSYIIFISYIYIY